MTHGVGSKASRKTLVLASALAALALLGAAAPTLLVESASAESPPPPPPSVPDLRVASIGLSTSNPFGTGIAVQVTNEGTAAAEDFRLRVTTSDGTILVNEPISWLFHGSSITYETFGSTVVYGLQTVTAEVDTENTVAESDETDNVLIAEVDFGHPDLVPAFGDITYLAIPGTSPGYEPTYTAHIPVHVRNVGTAAAHGVSAAIDGLTATAQPVPPGGLHPGGFTTFWFTWQGPAGEHPVTAVADPTDAVPESDEANNRASVVLRPGLAPDLPDLLISDVYLTAPYDDPAGTQATIRVENMGAKDAPATHLSVRYDDGPAQHINVIALPAGHVTWYSAPWPEAPGRHTLVAFIDPEQLIEEQNEWNNEYWFEAGEDQADLTVAIDMPDLTNKAYGDEVRIAVHVTNGGSASAPPSVLSLEDSNVLVERALVPGLAPGATHTVFIETLLTPGAHPLAARADVDNVVAELNEQNNAAALQLNLGAPVLDVRALGHDQEVPEEGITMHVEAAFGYTGVLRLAAAEVRLYDGEVLLATWTLHGVTDGDEEALGFAWDANEGDHTLRLVVTALGTGAAEPAHDERTLDVHVRAPTPASCQTAGVTPGVQETCRRLLLGEPEPAEPLVG